MTRRRWLAAFGLGAAGAIVLAGERSPPPAPRVSEPSVSELRDCLRVWNRAGRVPVTALREAWVRLERGRCRIAFLDAKSATVVVFEARAGAYAPAPASPDDLLPTRNAIVTRSGRLRPYSGSE